MGTFKYPYTNYEQINLDWIMKKIKALEPAVQMVEDSAEALAEAQRVATVAEATAVAANAAVESVTEDAATAVATAEEAKEIAQQAASATIADGSVTMIKLGSDVTTAINNATSDAASATTTANQANLVATNAAQNAANANQSAANALIAAQQADAKAEQALNMGFADWVRYANIGGNGTSLEHSVSTPVAKEYLIVLYTLNAPNRRQTMVIPYQAVQLGGNYYTGNILNTFPQIYIDSSTMSFNGTVEPTASAVIYIR